MIKEGYTRCTEAISWCSGIHQVPADILEVAADRGSRVHQSIEDQLKGFGGVYGNDIDGFLGSFDKLVQSGLPHGPMDTEKRFYCDSTMLTGQMDCCVHTPDGLEIFDWKTSAKEYPGFRLQAAAYRYLAEKEFRVSSVKFVRLMKSGGKPKVYCYDETYESDLEMFWKCLEIYRFFN